MRLPVTAALALVLLSLPHSEGAQIYRALTSNRFTRAISHSLGYGQNPEPIVDQSSEEETADGFTRNATDSSMPGVVSRTDPPLPPPVLSESSGSAEENSASLAAGGSDATVPQSLHRPKSLAVEPRREPKLAQAHNLVQRIRKITALPYSMSQGTTDNDLLNAIRAIPADEEAQDAFLAQDIDRIALFVFSGASREECIYRCALVSVEVSIYNQVFLLGVAQLVYGKDVAERLVMTMNLSEVLIPRLVESFDSELELATRMYISFYAQNIATLYPTGIEPTTVDLLLPKSYALLRVSGRIPQYPAVEPLPQGDALPERTGS